MKTFDFHSVDMRIIENRKKWFTIPFIVLLIAIIAGIVYGIVLKGEVFNVGMDFTGGYALTVEIGTDLDDADKRAEYEDQITDIIEHPDKYYDLMSERRDISGLVVKDIAAQGEGADKSLRVQFVAPDYNDTEMVGTGEENSVGIIDLLCEAIQQTLFDEPYAGSVTAGDRTTATVSTDLIVTAICGIVMSLALMLIYIAVRFELLSGVVALICLTHDVIMMVLFMCIFHIEIASTFVAALITILGYSINNTIIIFDKIRDDLKVHPDISPTNVANVSVRDTMVRSINTTLTTFVTVAMIAIMSAIFGVGDLLTFCLPLIAGLIAGMFSSVLIAPSLWAIWKEHLNKKKAAIPAGNVPSDKPVRDDTLENFFADKSNDASENASSVEEKADDAGSDGAAVAKGSVDTDANEAADSVQASDDAPVDTVSDDDTADEKKEEDNNA